MDKVHSHNRFLRVFVLVFLLVCMMGAGFNFLVDPYDLFGTHRAEGFNALKPAAAERVRTSKPYMASRVKPKVVIGGNSRPEMGLDPRSPCWGKADQPVFNMGIPGAGVFMQTRYAQHAVESGKAKRVFFGVDFLDFLVDASKPTGKIDWSRLGGTFEGRLLPGPEEERRAPYGFQRAEDTFGGLFSLVALSDSIATIASQRDKNTATRHENGFNPGFNYRPIIGSEGQAVLFRQKNQEVGRRLQSDKLGILDVRGQRSVPLASLKRMLAWAKIQGIEVVLFINPYHADYLIQIDMAGKWPLLEAWKRELAGLADEYAVPLWDFNAIDRYSTESPPLSKDTRTELAWFWEPAHYRRELGDLMLATMLDSQCGQSRGPIKLGAKITTTSLPRHLDALRVDLHRYMDANPQAVERLRGGGG